MEDTIIVNIGRQLGSGGRQIGERIARRLNLRFYDRELLALAAEQSGLCTELFEKADEKESNGRLATLLGYLRGPFAGDDGGMTNVLSNDALFKIQSDAIRRAAAGGSCVFVGRCADYILRDLPQCVNVFVTAAEADRIARVRARHGWSEEQARQEMARVDARRAAYYNYYSDRTWGAASSYHLCIDSSVLGIEGSADFVLEYVARKLNRKFE